MTLVIGLAPASVDAQVSGKEAMKRLMSLEGQWEVQSSHGVFQGQEYGPVVTDPAGVVRYEVLARGTTVVATNLRPKGNEMFTVYYMDGKQLLADHFCVNGVVTRARLNEERSTRETLAFDFLGTSNLGSKDILYMHNDSLMIARNGKDLTLHVVTFRDGERVERMTQELARIR